MLIIRSELHRKKSSNLTIPWSRQAIMHVHCMMSTHRSTTAIISRETKRSFTTVRQFEALTLSSSSSDEPLHTPATTAGRRRQKEDLYILLMACSPQNLSICHAHVNRILKLRYPHQPSSNKTSQTPPPSAAQQICPLGITLNLSLPIHVGQ